MTKPRLEKVKALFYVFKHIAERGCAYFDTASFFYINEQAPTKQGHHCFVLLSYPITTFIVLPPLRTT